MNTNIRINKVFSIVFQCTVVVLLIAALLYFTPWPTRIDLTLNAVKLDAGDSQRLDTADHTLASFLEFESIIAHLCEKDNLFLPVLHNFCYIDILY